MKSLRKQVNKLNNHKKFVDASWQIVEWESFNLRVKLLGRRCDNRYFELEGYLFGYVYDKKTNTKYMPKQYAEDILRLLSENK